MNYSLRCRYDLRAKRILVTQVRPGPSHAVSSVGGVGLLVWISRLVRERPISMKKMKTQYIVTTTHPDDINPKLMLHQLENVSIHGTKTAAIRNAKARASQNMRTYQILNVKLVGQVVWQETN